MRIALAAVAVAVLGIAGCGASVTKTSAPATTAPAAPATTKPAPSPSNSLSGPVDTTYTVTDDSGNKMEVTLTRVIDPAQGADQFTTPDSGSRFIGAVFSLHGISGTFSGNATNDATLIGSNGQTYGADFNSIAGYTNFNSGDYNVGARENSVGAVTFQVPLAVKVTKIEWSASGGFGGAPAEWLVPAVAGASPSGTAGAVTGPWAVVSAFYGYITAHDYAAAWRLLGPALKGGSYASFAAGYAGTGRQTVTKISESGDRVSFTLRSDNPDGTVQAYRGTDTVGGGKIVAATVVQTAPPPTRSAQALSCRASVSSSFPADYTTVDIDVQTAAGASVTTVAHYKTTDHQKTAVADGAGQAAVAYYISGATPGYKVTVDVTASAGSRTASCSTSFTPES